MKKEKTAIVRVSSKEMNVNEFRKRYITLGKQKDKYEKELEAYANKFLEKNYNTSLTIPIKISGRLTSSGGYFKYQMVDGNRVPIDIHISERYVASALHDGQEGLEAILDTLKHELIHYVLCKTGKDFNDGDDEFESELKRLNVGASGTTRKDLVKTEKLTVWYKPLDVYEQESYDILENKLKTIKTYRKHTQKPARRNRIGYEVVKSYF